MQVRAQDVHPPESAPTIAPPVVNTPEVSQNQVPTVEATPTSIPTPVPTVSPEPSVPGGDNGHGHVTPADRLAAARRAAAGSSGRLALR